MNQCQLLIKNAKVFARGLAPVVEDVAICDGKILQRGNHLEISAEKVIDGHGKWLMPGLFDIHTHYDLELELAPGLPESTRHGTTTVVIANCSLGLAFGSQRSSEHDPVVSCYARVENIPKHVLSQCADKLSWHNTQGYLDHLGNLNLGPNVIPMVPHSMLRIEAMGFEESISRDPNPAEMTKMSSLLTSALNEGYAGFSTDALPFHYLANQPHTQKTIPTQFATFDELRTLTNIVRDKNRVWQATPPKDSVLGTLKTLLLTSGRLYGKPLKTTVVAAMRIANNWKLLIMVHLLSRLLNSYLVNGKFYMQALGARFKTWSDGAITPLAEEIPELRRLNETDLEDRQGRAAILNDPEYRKAFKSMWMSGKQGISIARIKRLINLEDFAFHRDIKKMVIDICPITAWQGKTFEQIYSELKSSKSFEDQWQDFAWVQDEADFVLQMLLSFDTDLSWHTITGNPDEKTVRQLLMNPLFIPGFNDSGAHLTNMAFYDANLRSLKLAAEGGEADVSYIVKRLTLDAAELFGVDGGHIDVGAKADIILIDPIALANYDGEANVKRIYREEFNNEQLVNRSDGVVNLVVIGGKVAWEVNQPSSDLGSSPMGQVLLAV
jgi:N-acyl-D-aspartate/D-glutamate deacylase